MGCRNETTRTVFTCELCRVDLEVATPILMDATSEARAAEWDERKPGNWFCGECIALARELAKTSYT